MEVRSATGRRLLRGETQRRAAGTRGRNECDGHFGRTCYHRVFVSNQFGDPECSRFQPATPRAEEWPLPATASEGRSSTSAPVRLSPAGDLRAAGRRRYRYATGLPANQVSQRRRSPPDLGQQAGGRWQPSRRDAPMIGPEPPDRDPNSAYKHETRCANRNAGNVA
jgi:hypothetical protein